MSAYVVANYTVTNPEAFEPYVPGVMPTIAAGGGEVLVADFESDPVEGNPGHVTVVLKFESKDAINAWYTSDEYEAVKGAPHRQQRGQHHGCRRVRATHRLTPRKG